MTARRTSLIVMIDAVETSLGMNPSNHPRNGLLFIHADLSLTTTSSVMVVIETSRETDLMASEDVTVTIVPATRIDGKDRLCRTMLFLLFSRLDYWSSLICRDDLR